MTLIVRPGYGGAAVSDPDAQTYLQAVEVADNQALEQGVQQAVNQFVIGCKADGIWTAIKASCILAGARTRLGALTPLVGTAPTPFNFVDANYDRKTGLVGDGSTKYLDSNRNNNVDPQNSRHAAVFATTRNTEDIPRAYIRSVFATEGGTQVFSGASPSKLSSRLADATTVTTTANLHSANGFFGVNRSGSTQYQARGSTTNETITQSSVALGSANYYVFAGNNRTGPVIDLYATARIAFYSIGESLDLALLDARVSALITAFGVAIP